MTGVKRPAEEPLEPIHSVKQARILKTRSDDHTASSSQPGLMEEWKGWVGDSVLLVDKTARKAFSETKRLARRARRSIWGSSVSVSPPPPAVPSPTLPPKTLSTLPVADPSFSFQFRSLLPRWCPGALEAHVVTRTGQALPAQNQLGQDLDCSTKGAFQFDLLEEQCQMDQEDTWPRTDIGVPPHSDEKLRRQQSLQHWSQGPENTSDAFSHKLAFDASLSNIQSTDTRRLASEPIDLLSRSSLLSECVSSLNSQPNNSQTCPEGHPPEFLLGYAPTIGLDAALAALPPRKIKPAIKQGKQRPYKKRQHILHTVHKAKVHADRLQMREEFTKRLYDLRRVQGYSSSLDDFKGLLNYERRVEQAVNGSASIATVRGSSSAVAPAPPVDEYFLLSAFKKALVTIKSPGPPKPFAPTLDQMQISERVKDEAIESRLRPSRPSLPSQLPSQDDAVVSNILKKRGIVAKFAREQVTDQDIERLKPGQWLNDELINFYGAMILARSDGCKENSPTNGQGTPLNVHFFSTFFWTKLTKEGYEKARLAKWTKKIDIFSKDVILIPVNHNNAHWTAGAINLRKKRIESYDSMGMAKEQVFKHLRAYLDAEHRNKKKKEFDFTDWENWAPDDTPQQENGYDCGVFTCQFLQALSQGRDDFIFTQKDMPYLRRRMIWEIGNARLRDD